MSKLFTVTTDSAAIERMASAIVKTGNWLDHSMKVMGLSMALHAIQHGNVGPANKVLQMLTKQTEDDKGRVSAKNKSALRLDWFTRMMLNVGPFTHSGGKFHFDRVKCDLLKQEITAKTEKQWVFDNMKRDWAAEKPETIFEGYSAVEKVMKMVKSMEGDLLKADRAPHIRDADPAFFTRLKEIIRDFEVTPKPKKPDTFVPAH